ncbi:MAG TPA: flagellar biosynthesis protein FliO [Xanthobacteraceae bacterium]|nr:flagellar biosynthesis protein FliO [Xanthobacteraceae bacterium]
MIDSLLGVELPLPVKLIVAFVVVLALIALATWVFRRLGGDRASPSVARGRQPRLAVIDAASVDGRRRLVLVRRDNVEHLIMIGGPADLVIEQNIVRAVPVTPPGPRPMAEPTVRAVPPAAPEPAPPRPAAEAYRERPAAEARPRVEPLARPAPRPEPARMHPAAEPPRAPRAMPRRESDMRRAEPDFAAFESPAGPPGGDSKLADMASKLEAALRRAPAPPPRADAPPPRAEPDNGPVLQGPTPPTVPAAEPAGPPKPVGEGPAPAESTSPEPSATAARMAAPHEDKDKDKPASDNPAAKSMFDSLEEEMASLLGRPPGKP